MAANWGDAEVRELLALRAEEEIHRQITGTVKDGPVLEGLAKKMQERGYKRDKSQVITKLKNLRKKYHQVNDHNGRSGRGRLDWPYFNLCSAIWGTSHSANPLALVGNLEEPGPSASTSGSSSPIPASTSCSDAGSKENEAPLEPPENAPAPPPAKRRKVSRVHTTGDDFSLLMKNMQRDEVESDRLRQERQMAHELQIMRETYERERESRESREAHMDRFASTFFSLFRELTSRTPAPAPPIHFLPSPPPHYSRPNQSDSYMESFNPPASSSFHQLD